MAGPRDAGVPPESVLLQQFAGLRNTVAPERLGPGDLEIALNVDLDDVGQPRRRRGYTRVSTGAFHSLHRTSGGKILVVKDGALGLLRPDYSFVALGVTAGDDPLAYTEVASAVYYASRSVSGRVNADETISPWGAATSEGVWLSPVVNPTATLGAIRGKLLGKPPLASALTYYNGRIYLANETTLWATELYLYDFVDKTKNFIQFEHEITCLGAVSDGFYVGTTSAVYFLSGTLNQMQRLQVYDVGALPGSMIVTVADGLPNQKTVSRAAVLVMTDYGLCVGYDAGIFSSLTDDKMWFPKAESVAPMLRRQDGMTQYVGVANSGGTPASNARIGDFVDAEIRRFQGA